MDAETYIKNAPMEGLFGFQKALEEVFTYRLNPPPIFWDMYTILRDRVDAEINLRGEEIHLEYEYEKAMRGDTS